MKWTERKEKVEQLGRLASLRSNDVATHRCALRSWFRNTLGSPEGLAWSFAAGALWSASRDSNTETVRKSRALERIANLAWLVLPYLGRAGAAQSDDDAP
ncbi:MAG: hypothetical protein WBM54_12455, partial [Woeseia sp.]